MRVKDNRPEDVTSGRTCVHCVIPCRDHCIAVPDKVDGLRELDLASIPAPALPHTLLSTMKHDLLAYVAIWILEPSGDRQWLHEHAAAILSTINAQDDVTDVQMARRIDAMAALKHSFQKPLKSHCLKSLLMEAGVFVHIIDILL